MVLADSYYQRLLLFLPPECCSAGVALHMYTKKERHLLKKCLQLFDILIGVVVKYAHQHNYVLANNDIFIFLAKV